MAVLKVSWCGIITSTAVKNTGGGMSIGSSATQAGAPAPAPSAAAANTTSQDL
jgi:hypothetical protein